MQKYDYQQMKNNKYYPTDIIRRRNNYLSKIQFSEMLTQSKWRKSVGLSTRGYVPGELGHTNDQR